MVNAFKKSLLVSVMALSFTQAYAATDYEIRMPSGADTVVAAEAEPAVVADGATNSSTLSAIPLATGSTSKLTRSGTHSNSAYFEWHVVDGSGLPGSSSHYGWLAPFQTLTGWLSYEFDAPLVINKYAFYGASAGGVTSLPGSFNFQGSNDGVTWVVLGTESNVNITADAFNYYSVVNDTAYLHYKFNITQNNGSPNYLGMYEIKFIEAEAN